MDVPALLVHSASAKQVPESPLSPLQAVFWNRTMDRIPEDGKMVHKIYRYFLRQKSGGRRESLIQKSHSRLLSFLLPSSRSLSRSF